MDKLLFRIQFAFRKNFLMKNKIKCLVNISIDSQRFSSNQSSKDDNLKKSSKEINEKLMSFFDLPENWTKDEVKSGRSWRIDELRIKSNNDLHKLWYILLKERNMLMTMEQAAKDNVENMVSPERLVKVEDSMKNIEEVVKERNHAYWKLEIGNSNDNIVERRRSFRRDIFGRWRLIACSEHLIPYWMNTEWRKLNSPGFGDDVQWFKRRLSEIKLNKHMSKLLKQRFYCQQLLRRFPNIDLDYLQELYPEQNIKELKENIDEYTAEVRQTKFNHLFYQKRKSL